MSIKNLSDTVNVHVEVMSGVFWVVKVTRAKNREHKESSTNFEA